METPVVLNVQPLNAPQKDLKWQALADMDYQIAEEKLMSRKFHLHLLNELKAKHENGTDILGLWDSSSLFLSSLRSTSSLN